MKTRNLIIIIGLALLSNACVIKSLNPFYTEKDLNFKKDLIGTWADNDSGKWVIEQYKFSKGWNKGDSLDRSYKIIYSDKSNKAVFNGHIFMINNELYADFYPLMSENFKDDDIITTHLLPTHSLAKLTIKNDEEFTIKVFDEEWLRKLIDGNKIRISYIKVKRESGDFFGDYYVLTAPTDELQKFIFKFGKDSKAFDNTSEPAIKNGEKPFIIQLKRIKDNEFSK